MSAPVKGQQEDSSTIVWSRFFLLRRGKSRHVSCIIYIYIYEHLYQPLLQGVQGL